MSGMIVLNVFAVFCALCFTSADVIQVELAEEIYDLLWPCNDTSTCVETEWEITVNNTVGLGLNVTVNELKLDSDSDFFLALTSENDPEMLGTEASVVYLSGDLTNIKLAMPFVDKFYLKLVIKEPCDSDKNYFDVTISRLEKREQIHATPPPNHNPPDGIPTEIPVHFSGKTVSEFMGLIPVLQQRLKQLALNFCKDNRISCDSSKPADETVFLRDIGSCPESWDEHEICVKAWLAVFVTVDPKEYELTPEHLTKFWKHVENIPGVFEPLGLKPYDFSDASLEILWWLLWILIALFIAGVIGYLLWRMEVLSEWSREIQMFEEEEQRRKDIFDGVTLRKRPPPMALSKHQKIPDFMLSNGDASSILTATSTPPATKKHALRPILKQASSEGSPIAVEGIRENTPSPKSPSFIQNRPHWFMFNQAYEEDEEEVVFSNEGKV